MSREYRSGFPAKTGMMQLILLPPSEDNARHHSGSGGCEIQINVQGKLQRLSVTIPTTQKRAFSDNTSRVTGIYFTVAKILQTSAKQLHCKG
uniref:Uncharacterized protein n=1 Tax=Physcomitrium patens TaxID=3218 RepID=A0A2K1JJ36_PHYPA|nr:hypothetical protein PHYPA_018961 [Physcomitrium patens]